MALSRAVILSRPAMMAIGRTKANTVVSMVPTTKIPTPISTHSLRPFSSDENKPSVASAWSKAEESADAISKGDSRRPSRRLLSSSKQRMLDAKLAAYKQLHPDIMACVDYEKSGRTEGYLSPHLISRLMRLIHSCG